jgi:nitrite reductase/ring-hydroxylating ferredoxin subunit
MTDPLLTPSRRTVLAGAGATALVVLTGCTTYGAGGNSGGNSGGPPPAISGSPTRLTTTADVPVGGGVISDQGVVVTQPTAGTFLGFSAVCTHQGCTVSSVKDGKIVCPCHQSAFRIADGSVAGGPANRALPAIAVKVDGTDIFRA